MAARIPGQAACLRCSRVTHVGADGLCRPCLLAVLADDPGWVREQLPGRPLQLAFLLPGVRLPRASPLLNPANSKDKLRRQPIADVVATINKWPWLAPQPQPVSPHLVDPAQGVLFDVRRDWGCLNAGELDQLPSLTSGAGSAPRCGRR